MCCLTRLGLIPLPSKWIIEFGEPIPTDHLGDGAADDPVLVFDITDRVPSITAPNPENIRYLRTKRERMGHLLEGLDDVL